MPTSSYRYKTFLSTYKFHNNSINFRILSSKALEKFKNVQSFQLNQLKNGKFYFSRDRREILLLKYDMWSRWIIEIENLCIEMIGNEEVGEIKSKDIELITLLAKKTEDKYKTVILKENKEKFDQEFTKIWLEVHNSAFLYMLDEINMLKGLTYTEMFIKLVDILIEIMQYTLIELHELDSIFCKLKSDCNTCNHRFLCPRNKTDDLGIFIVITPFTKKCFDNSKLCLVSERIKTYQKYFEFNEIYFKNYTDEKLSISLIENIEKFNIKIDYMRSLFQ